MQGLDFKKSLSDSTKLIIKRDFDIVVTSLYVDDRHVTGNNLEMINEFKVEMKKVFEMTDLGEISYFLRMKDLSNPQ